MAAKRVVIGLSFADERGRQQEHLGDAEAADASSRLSAPSRTDYNSAFRTAAKNHPSS
jgi:hypothetical protein